MKRLLTWLFGEPHKHTWKKKDRLTVFGFPSEHERYKKSLGHSGGGDWLPVNLTTYRCSCGKEKRVYRDIWDKKYKEVVIV